MHEATLAAAPAVADGNASAAAAAQQRLEDQIGWYDGKSRHNQRWFKRLKVGVSATGAPKVFISYRRHGTAMHAGRLYDAMVARFGDHNVFMDLEMAPGVDFVERITTAVGSPGVTVIPVLVEGAQMPSPEQLPPALRPLARRNAIELSDLRWRYDCQRLMTALDDLLGGQATVGRSRPRAAAAPAPARALLPLCLEGVAVAVAAGLLAHWAFGFLGPPDDPTVNETIAGQIQLRAACWAAVVAALAVWLTLRRGDRGRLLRRTAMGLLLGGLAGALGGGLWSLLCFVLPESDLDGTAQQQVQILALALTGGIVGAGIGLLWIPPRALAGCLAGAAGGALVQVATNLPEDRPPGTATFALNCFAIVGVVLLVQLLLDVRSAVAVRRTALAAEPAAP